jgi:hypothetical protein
LRLTIELAASDVLACPRELVTFREDEGGGEHCHEGVVALFHQRTFDWLDTPLRLSRIH